MFHEGLFGKGPFRSRVDMAINWVLASYLYSIKEETGEMMWQLGLVDEVSDLSYCLHFGALVWGSLTDSCTCSDCIKK